MSENKSHRNYYPEIDGLRAVAILGVVLFHFFPSFVPSGFLGVDIFFIISGYLVSSIIFREIKHNNFSFIEFYKRRVLRLFPALIVVTLSTMIIGLILLFSKELVELSKQVMFASIFSNNFLYYTQSGYFDTASHSKPLLHYWSLSVEEQFYMVWPTFLILISKFNISNKIRATLLIILISACAFLYYSVMNPNFAFYLLPTRIWQLAIGFLVYLFLELYEEKIAALTDNSHVLIKGLFKSFGILFVSSVLLIFLRTYGGAMQPLITYFISTTTALFLLFRRRDFTKSIFSSGPMVYIGKVSYPWYLWHWPLVSFAYIYFKKKPDFEVLLLLFFISFVLAVITYEKIEKKFKFNHTQNSSSAAQVLLAGFVVSFSFGLILYLNKGFPNRFAELEKVYNGSLVLPIVFPEYKCLEDVARPSLDLCAITDSSKKPDAVVIGDSHAHHLFPGLNKVLKEKNINLLLAARSGIPALMNIGTQGVNLDDVFQYIADLKSVKTVYLAGFWNIYIRKENVTKEESYHFVISHRFDKTNRTGEELFEIGLHDTLNWAKKNNIKIVFVHDIPALKNEFPTCLKRPFNDNLKNCDQSYEGVFSNQTEIRRIISQLKSKGFNFAEIDMLKAACKDDICYFNDVNGIPLYGDTHHLNEHGSIYTINNLREQILGLH